MGWRKRMAANQGEREEKSQAWCVRFVGALSRVLLDVVR